MCTLSINLLNISIDREIILFLSQPNQATIMKTITLLLTTLLFSATAFASIPSSEKQALIDFYNSTNGDEWTTSWNLNEAPSTWKGVTIFRDRVLALSLKENNLSGTIPTSISQLTSLKVLDLQKNKISGIIPSSLSKIKGLKTINLSINKFSGDIPAEVLAMASLEYLDLFFNELQGSLPSDMTGLKNLKRLSIYSNNINGDLPSSICSLKNLKDIQINDNNFSGELPSRLASLPQLKRLSVYDNEFEGDFPKSLNSLNLDNLTYHNNNFKNISNALAGER